MRRFDGFDASTLKILAIVSMTADHVAGFFQIEGDAGTMLHLFGRLAAPIMFFFVAQGYAHTRNVPRYALRLFVFALLSHIPYYLLYNPAALQLPDLRIPMTSTSVIWTLLMGLCAIWSADKAKNPVLRASCVCACAFLAWKSDWSFFGVLFCLGFWIFRDSKPRMFAAFVFVTLAKYAYVFHVYGNGDFASYLSGTWFQLGVVLALPFVFAYGGKRGVNLGKYTFYLYYPLHLTALFLLTRFL